jgi:[acyl-carrier-protein] S-malonyltransferase
VRGEVVGAAKSFALFFPGQGAQYAGMGKEICEVFPKARAVFEGADRVLGFSLSRLCFEGPQEELDLTVNAQPAIFVTSLAAWEAVKKKYPELRPHAACGLSLGEFTALVAAGAMDFEEGLALVRKRGAWMHEAGLENPGGMCSVIGLGERECERVAKSCAVEVANYNAPGQIVLSGRNEGIQEAMKLAKERGAKKVVALKVSGAFHSALMRQAQTKLRDELSKTHLQPPKVDFVANVNASWLSQPDEIRASLAEQVTHPVRWLQTVQLLHDKGFRAALEPGPGRVLRGLVKRTVEEFAVHSVETPADIERVGAFFDGAVTGA